MKLRVCKVLLIFDCAAHYYASQGFKVASRFQKNLGTDHGKGVAFLPLAASFLLLASATTHLVTASY